MDTTKDNSTRGQSAQFLIHGQSVTADFLKMIALLNGWKLDEICHAIELCLSGDTVWLEFKSFGTLELKAAAA